MKRRRFSAAASKQNFPTARLNFPTFSFLERLNCLHCKAWWHTIWDSRRAPPPRVLPGAPQPRHGPFLLRETCELTKEELWNADATFARKKGKPWGWLRGGRETVENRHTRITIASENRACVFCVSRIFELRGVARSPFSKCDSYHPKDGLKNKLWKIKRKFKFIQISMWKYYSTFLLFWMPLF